MKKRDLLLAGLFLCTVPVLAQSQPPRYADDSKVIFRQDFEKANPSIFNMENGIRLNPDDGRPTTLYTWDANPVDRIDQVTYYKLEGHSNPGGGTNIYTDKTGNYEIAGIRDTVMLLYDGVLKTDAVQPDDSVLAADRFSIEQHTAETQQGKKGLDAFAEKGGNQYFSYSSASGLGYPGNPKRQVANWSSSDGGYVPEYRRNLFIRNLPIEEGASYRVTVFVKPTKLGGATVPRIALDLMRGYFHSEKPFLVDFKAPKNWWESPASFADKTNYTDLKEGEWNKIVLMSYYISDSVGRGSAYMASYYWQGDWDWEVGRNADKEVVNDLGRGKARNAAGQLVNVTDPAIVKDTTKLTFIQQPDKFFVRMSFRSDSTRFDVDNLSLTKSWIAGVEHHNDLLRVNFGYQTNMGSLAQAALEKNKIAAVELPGEYFTVWARFENKQTHKRYWSLVPINSAEYHGDGYMYMWTKPWEDDGSLRSFEGADSVLVSFRNPVDREDLKLLYTGTQYPNGGNVEWQNDKKKRLVFDFHNEMSSLNPNIDYSNGKKVLSLKDLPPVLQRLPYEDGTFGLNPNISEMTFKFSRQLVFENKGSEDTNLSFIKVVDSKGAVEYWEFKTYADAADTNTVIVRPAKYKTPLAGDYKITIDQITHLDDAKPTDLDSYAADVVLNLHFGDFDLNSIPQVVTFSNWRADIIEYDGLGQDKCPVPTSVYLHTGTQAFGVGTGDYMTKCGFYPTKDDTITVFGTRIPDNGMFYIAGQKGTGNLYSIVSLNKGNYFINFKFAGRNTTNYPMGLKFYAKPAGELADGNDNGFKTLDGVANKTVLEAGKKPAVNMGYQFPITKTWDEKTITCSYPFSVPANGDYVFEWTVTSSDNNGFVISNYWITSGGDLSFGPVGKVNAAIADAQAKIDQVNAIAKYQGSAFEALKNVKNAAGGFIAAKKATGVNLPSEYDAEVEVINNAIKAVNSRIELIDGFFKTLADAQAKVDIYKTADSLAAYKDLPDVQALQDLKNSYANYDYASKNDAAINAENNFVKAAINGIDNRVALIAVWPQVIDYAKKMKADAEAQSIDVTDLTAAIAAAELLDDDLFTYAELRAKMVELSDIAFKTVYSEEIKPFATRRITELDALAKQLGADSYYPAGFAAGIATVEDDNDSIADIIKCAIKIAIYDKIVKGQAVENIDLTPFIKNYYLYVTVKDIVDRYVHTDDGTIGSNKNNMTGLSGAANIMTAYHRYSDAAVKDSMHYLLIPNQEFVDLYPGWSSQSFVNGNTMVSPDVNLISYPNFSTGKTVFDGMLSLDWGSTVELKQTIEGLPVGVYSIGATVTNGSINSANITAVSDVQTYTKDIKSDGKLDNVIVLEQTLDLDYKIETGNGTGGTDNFSLTYNKYDDPLFQQFWQQLLDNAKSELDNLVTVVDKAKAVATGVEYYTISGIKLNAPKAGQILIRKTTKSNGKVVVDKVLIK